MEELNPVPPSMSTGGISPSIPILRLTPSPSPMQMKLGQSPSVAAKLQAMSLAKKRKKIRLQTLTRARMDYPIDCPDLTVSQPANDYPLEGEDRSPIARIAFHPLAKCLAMTRAGGDVEIRPLPFATTRKVRRGRRTILFMHFFSLSFSFFSCI